MSLKLIVAYADAKKKLTAEQTHQHTHTATDTTPAADTGRWAGRALQAEVEAVTTATEGTRNHTLNRAAFNLGQLVAGGHLNEHTVTAALTIAAHDTGLSPRETEATIRSGLKGGQQHPRTGPATPLAPYPELATFDDQGDTFWTARPILQHIHTVARARRACPWAVLGVVLARVITATPVTVVLPPLVGAEASLNTFIAIVATSGGGKGASERAAKAALTIDGIDTAGAGSGEGIAHLFAHRTKNGTERHRTAVLLSVPEIDTLAALGDRKGATLLPELRKAWSGEDLGFAYADPTKALSITEHTYRLTLLAGVQPDRAGWVLDDAGGGTPQRFLWLPAEDTTAPDNPPPCPKPITWTKPAFPRYDGITGLCVLPICQQATDEVDAARLARLRGEGEALDGHALLARLKAAAALALLDERAEVTDDDWALSGHLAAISDHTRGQVLTRLQRAAQDRNRGRAESEADRAVLVHERVEDAAIQRVCRTVQRVLKDGSMGSAELRRKVTSKDRQHLDQALERLDQAGQITAEDIHTGGIRWALA